jgi:hypothetical protein
VIGRSNCPAAAASLVGSEKASSHPGKYSLDYGELKIGMKSFKE